MTDEPRSGNPLLDAWLRGQREFLKGQETFLAAMKSMASADDAGEALGQAQANWALAERQASDWWKTATRWFHPLPADGEDPEGVAQATLRAMLDPSRFLYAGTDEVSRALQRLVEGPEFADIGTLERKVVKTTREWVALREASADYRAVTAAAWMRAFETFSKEMASDPAAMNKGARAVLDRWLAIANEELIRTQRTEEFLESQRRLLRAGVDYRLKERELVELWCESHSMPTRTEVDDLHRIVHDLSKRVRDLERRLAAAGAPDKPRARRRKAASRPKAGSPPKT